MKKIIELMDITQIELNAIEDKMVVGEYKTIHNDKNMRIDLLKERPKKVHEIVYTFGDNPFLDVLKEMVQIAYPN